jgi:oligopeptide transport system permease protein
MTSPTRQNLSPSYQLWQRFRSNRIAYGASIILVLLILSCFLLPLFIPYSPFDSNLEQGVQPPSVRHWMGTDIQGRDLLSRILQGGQVSFTVGIAGTAVAVFIGTLYGAIAAIGSTRRDSIMMRIVDILYAFPFLIVVVLLTVYFEDFRNSQLFLFLTIGCIEWLTMARVIRSRVLALKPLPYILAARCLGRTNSGILRVHLLPNLLGLIIVYGSLTIPRVMLLEAYLSFLGLGIQPPLCSWGRLIKEGTDVMEDFSWLVLFPSLIFFITLLCLNLAGEGLRQALDPKEQK